MLDKGNGVQYFYLVSSNKPFLDYTLIILFENQLIFNERGQTFYDIRYYIYFGSPQQHSMIT